MIVKRFYDLEQPVILLALVDFLTLQNILGSINYAASGASCKCGEALYRIKLVNLRCCGATSILGGPRYRWVLKGDERRGA